DLRRFLAGEPIISRPTPAWGRGAEWGKRGPAPAGFIGGGGVGVFHGLALCGVWGHPAPPAAEGGGAPPNALENKSDNLAKQARENEKLAEEKANQERENARLAQEKATKEAELKALAEENFIQARDAVKSMLTRVGGVELRYEPRTEKVRQDLLQ